MARISTYTKDINLTDADKVIGSDANNNNATVNFPLGSILSYIEQNIDFISPTYTHIQSSAASTWTISHNMNKFPSVLIVDSAETVVVGEITYTTSNTITLTFEAAFSGKAYLN